MISNPPSRAEVVQYVTPTTGQTVTVNADTGVLVINPAGTLATLTINMPAGVPARGDGHIITIATSQILTAVTMGAGAGNTAIGAITTLALAGFAAYCYRQTVWYRCG